MSARRFANSLRLRLALVLTLGLAVLWALAAVAAMTALRQQTDALFDSALQETAQRILPLAAMDVVSRQNDPEKDEDAPPTQRVAEAAQHDEVLTYVVRDEAGRVALASHDANVANFPKQTANGFSTTPTHRLYAEQAMRGAITLIAAEPLSLRREAASRAARALALPLAALVPLSLFGVWAVVAWGVRPVRRLSTDISARGGGDLRPLDPAGLPSEMTPVAAAVNSLMERVRQTLDAERRFAANAAHELRTPIAAALAQAQRLSIGADAVARARIDLVVGRLRDLARLAEKLMQLARAQGARLIRDTQADAMPALLLTIEEARRANALGDRLTVIAADAEAPTRIDADALAIVLRNLIENAARHGDADAPVTATLRRDGLSVVNGGAIVPPEKLALLTRPFERSGEAPGSGLGLSIVAAIARETGAALTLASPPPGRQDGFEARFVWAV
jgi:two-component system OmpR family sensor kinase